MKIVCELNYVKIITFTTIINSYKAQFIFYIKLIRISHQIGVFAGFYIVFPLEPRQSKKFCI